MNTYELVKAAHSGLRYLVLLLIVLALIQSLAGWFGKKSYTNGNRKLNLFAMVSAHVQLLLGLILYFLSPYVRYSDMATAMKDEVLRYWTVEHAAMMIFALILITVGHARSKKAQEGFIKHRTVAIFYGLAALLVIFSILQSGRGLFGMTI
ncbi:MAG TPA: cytochrome B [Sphingobacteriaceae bacterium]